MTANDRPPSSTTCVHGGEHPDPATGALETPLVMSSAFAFDDAEQAAGAFTGENDHLIYGRWRNPTVSALEAKLVALEAGGDARIDACATASGMAAITPPVLACCRAGGQVLAPRSTDRESS